MDTGFFFALQPRWTGGDRLYKIFVTDSALCGARVAGQFYDADAAATQLLAPAGFLSLFLVPLVRTIVARRAQAEQLYDMLDPMGLPFLTTDKHNFRLFAHEVRRVELRTKPSWWVGGLPNGGTLKLEQINGSVRTFILVGEQDSMHVQQLIRKLVGDVTTIA
jgi:hypothetical protein